MAVYSLKQAMADRDEAMKRLEGTTTSYGSLYAKEIENEKEAQAKALQAVRNRQYEEDIDASGRYMTKLGSLGAQYGGGIGGIIGAALGQLGGNIKATSAQTKKEGKGKASLGAFSRFLNPLDILLGIGPGRKKGKIGGVIGAVINDPSSASGAAGMIKSEYDKKKAARAYAALNSDPLLSSDSYAPRSSAASYSPAERDLTYKSEPAATLNTEGFSGQDLQSTVPQQSYYTSGSSVPASLDPFAAAGVAPQKKQKKFSEIDWAV